MGEKKACGNCKFFLQGDLDAGKCRVNPPVLMFNGGEEVDGFPKVWVSDWCGAYRQKEGVIVDGSLLYRTDEEQEEMEQTHHERD